MLGLFVPSSALAQEGGEERTAAARALFERGMEFVDAGDFEQAADRFERSLELRFSPVVAYNLSIALVEAERYVEASERLREVIRAEEADAQLREAARAKLEEVMPHLGRLTVIVTGAADTVEVRRGGGVLADAVIGVAQPVDPGEHRVSIHRDGEELAARAVTVTAGGQATVELEAPEPPVREVPTPAETAASLSAGAGGSSSSGLDTGTEEEGGGILSSPLFWVGAGVVIAAVVVGVLLATRGEAQPVCGNTEPGCVDLE